MLLSNLTVSASACSALLNLRIPVVPDAAAKGQFYPPNSRSGSCPAPVPYPSGNPLEAAAFPLLLDAFVDGANVSRDTESKRKGELHFLASVFANLTAVRLGYLSSDLPTQNSLFLFADTPWSHCFPLYVSRRRRPLCW
jgi:hypothetical protein